MDSLITAAARALAAGDLISALKHVALRDDAPALALRGIAMARLGDLPRAKALLKAAALAFGPREAVARARCVVAEAEIALVSRDLAWPPKALEAARDTLARRGDRLNAAHARHLQVRRLLLIGRLDEAERALADIDADALPPPWRAAHELAAAGIALRRLRTAPARAAIDRAEAAAAQSRDPTLIAEVTAARAVLDAPAARRHDQDRLLKLDEVEALFASGALVVDAGRNTIRRGDRIVPLATRPVLFALARTLAEAAPGDASREALLLRAFRARHADESHRARLRVEIGRLRAELRGLADIAATPAGFALQCDTPVVVLTPTVESPHAAVLALLADGESWSSSALALALGDSQRTVQRALDALHAEGQVQPVGAGRARRWMTPPVLGFPTALLLPTVLAGG